MEVLPPKTAHTNGLIGIDFLDEKLLPLATGLFSSVPYDFFIKVTGKANFTSDTANILPLGQSKYDSEIIIRTLKLNCLTTYYSVLWKRLWNGQFTSIKWSKIDPRLSNHAFTDLGEQWCRSSASRSDYERRQALVELDVLSSMVIGITLTQLKTIYRIQFPVLQSYEADTWYDSTGRIVFTNNRSLTGVGFSRPEFENPNVVTPIRRSDAPWDGIMKHAPAGYVFARTITDDTMPGGPVERTIEYHAPFDRCDREQDYETAWKFFEEKYND